MSMSGDDAYVLAMDYVDETLKGGGALKGDDGKSAYQSWLDLGNTGTEEDFIYSLKGEKGQVGEKGETGNNGKSAYDLWLEAGNVGSEQDFLDSLKGADGTMSFDDLTEEQKESLKGDNGKSAYQYAKDGGYIGTETEFTTNIARSGVISKELEVERARIDNLTTLQDGSTTGDAELIDSRIDKDGNAHVNVGEHIRTVSSQLSSDITDVKGDLTDLDEILNVKHLRIASVTTTGSFVRAIAFSGLSLIGGHSYTFTVKPVSVTTNNYYLYFVDANGTETPINDKTDRITYNFTPTEDMNNVSIKVSSGASSEQTFECSWIENVGDNEIDKVNTRIDNLFDGTKVVELSILNGHFVTGASGYEGNVADDSESCTTSFIPVRPNDKLRIDNVYIESNRSICAYDEERNFVEVIVKNDYITSYTFTVPENCYYIRATGKTGVAPMVTFLSIPNNLDSLRVENPIATITNGYYITRYSGFEGETSSDSESAVTDFIPVKSNSVISIDGAYNDGFRCTCAYDVNKNFVAILVSSMTRWNFSKNIKIPSNARYIRITSRKDVVPTIKYVNTIIDGSNVSNPYVNGKELFDSATIKPVLTFIDDDTWDIEYVTRQKELCDRLGIKCSFACLTSRLENNQPFVDLLLSYERQGFPIVTHGYSQGVFYRPENENRNIVQCEDDLVHGLQDLHKYGFSDYKIWCTPFGVDDDDIKKLCIKWRFDGLITSGYVNVYNNPYEYSSRFSIKRSSLGSNTDTTASDIVDDVANLKLAIDNASECNGWLCISTHSAYPLYRNGEADDAMEEIVNYAISKGFEIRTVNEELRRRMPIYHYYEQF